MEKMNNLKRIGLGVILLTLMGCAAEEVGLPLLGGGKADVLGDDRVVFLNYWAVWCGPCIAEMPELADFFHEFSDRAVVYAINFDGVAEEQLALDVAALGVDIPSILTDPQPELGYGRPEVLPTTVVMQAGLVRDVLVGPQTLESMQASLDEWESNI
jgi:thiol-disulfide isomerase/thioredoxin|tara:strand:+ start:11448 stop:11918 length:471 start_codon:yes stop_codon:yes gene_type:complete